MRVLILGVTGMLGNALLSVLARDTSLEVWGTIRRESGARHFSEVIRRRLLTGVDVLDSDALVGTLARVRPDVVINCTGIIKQLDSANDPLKILPINAMFPHKLAGLCALAGTRLVVLSSDCVYSGRRGNYAESDPTDAEDLYGKSKSIGEVHDQKHVLTLRTSGIGRELGTRNGLLEWFLSQEGKVKGYARAIYSGLPSVELGRVIKDYVLPNPDLSGLYQVSGQPISKFDLLLLVSEIYGKNISIERDDGVVVDRSLNSRRFTDATGYVAPHWREMISNMYAYN
jgi:dTDP-4-dehydrorhamnose reductase